MNLPQFLDFLKQDIQFGKNLTGAFTIAGQDASFAPIPSSLDSRLVAGLGARGAGDERRGEELAHQGVEVVAAVDEGLHHALELGVVLGAGAGVGVEAELLRPRDGVERVRGQRLRERVEAAIMNCLYEEPPPASSIPDRGMMLAPRRTAEHPVHLVSHCGSRLHGLPSVLVV